MDKLRSIDHMMKPLYQQPSYHRQHDETYMLTNFVAPTT